MHWCWPVVVVVVVAAAAVVVVVRSEDVLRAKVLRYDVFGWCIGIK